MTKNLSRFKNSLKRHHKAALLALVGAALLTAFLSYFQMNSYEATLYDLRMRLQPDPSQKAPIALVTIDQKTIQALEMAPPLSISLYSQAIRTILSENPKKIALLQDFDAELLRQEEQKAHELVDMIQKYKYEHTLQKPPVIIGTSYDFAGEKVPPYPLNNLPHSVALIHRDGNIFSEDKVTRRAFLTINGQKTLEAEITEELTGISHEEVRGKAHFTEAGADYLFINYTGDTSIDSNTFPRVSFLDVLNGSYPEGFFKDKVVMIGNATFEYSRDYTYTPFSKASFTNPKLMVHANIMDTLWHNRAIKKAPEWINYLLTFITSWLIVYFILVSSPMAGVISTFTTMGVMFILALTLFSFFNLWINLIHPLFGIFFSYYIFVPHRAIIEYQKRWNLQKRNEILTQVEELKSNFMSLMSHDLKTPVAEIQGLAELLKIKGTLNKEELKTVNQILTSTDDLNKFITDILDLGKIETQDLKLDIKSNDINRIIENVVSNLDFTAVRKDIKLTTDLEPLFPTKMDAGLITRVLSNLIENAIKYSPNGSKVRIQSKEINDILEVTIEDQGPGISEYEAENVFNKFYRIKNDETMRTKGTGLGLYLVKYFIELHKGNISLESKPGKGSTFRITLPTVTT